MFLSHRTHNNSQAINLNATSYRFLLQPVSMVLHVWCCNVWLYVVFTQDIVICTVYNSIVLHLSLLLEGNNYLPLHIRAWADENPYHHNAGLHHTRANIKHVYYCVTLANVLYLYYCIALVICHICIIPLHNHMCYICIIVLYNPICYICIIVLHKCMCYICIVILHNRNVLYLYNCIEQTYVLYSIFVL